MNESLKYSDKGMDLTEDSEALRLTAYPDPGTGGAPWTCGWGHTGPDVFEGLVIDEAQAVAWLRADIAEAEAQVKELVEVELTQGEYDAVVDFVFNLGDGNFGRSSLLRFINAGNFAAAADEFAKWNRAAGKVLPGLTKRRLEEEKLFSSSDRSSASDSA